MRSINLTNLCMEEDDYTTKKKVYCNHGLVMRLKTTWTSNNPGRRYWSCPYYGGPRSCNFWCWKNKENIDPRSKFVIPKLIQKLGKLENIVESKLQPLHLNWLRLLKKLTSREISNKMMIV
ncbi:hypothetical protein R3W88_004971 [Solanum pinnatisectum]|uniref:GRF-type domain-containing protein n=1 Tax=Solanum pinnatisectum TaxID=50273 RepID=A0AAV9KC33_9SOLN|nr:hypothetical protein R3W88_004971 [Solanum pinnatisectum]